MENSIERLEILGVCSLVNDFDFMVKRKEMKLTIQELIIIIDTLLGSLTIQDRGRHWKYRVEIREILAKELMRRADMILVSIDTDEPKGEKEVEMEEKDC